MNVVEELDPIYPFDREAIHLLNQAASHNPRRLLELADLAIEYAASHRSYRVDTDVVNIVLAQRAANAASPASPPKPVAARPAPMPTPSPAPADVPTRNPLPPEGKASWAEG